MNDDIARFEYIKKTNKEKGPALVGIELKSKEDLEPLLKRMGDIELKYDSNNPCTYPELQKSDWYFIASLKLPYLSKAVCPMTCKRSWHRAKVFLSLEDSS